MATVIKKGKIGVNDITFYSSASPTFYRTTSSGGATNVTAVGATHVPVITAAASFQFSVNNVNRAVNELGGRARSASIRFISVGASFVSNSASHKSVSASLKSCAATLAISVPFFYRRNKPELSYALYGATYVVSCPASANAPSEVYINNAIYKNTGTILCDLSRKKTPATATVGGLDREQTTLTMASKIFYIYGSPSVSPTATRQWDMVASAGTPSGGPTASATFPQYTFLGAVLTTATPAGLIKFAQDGDKFRSFIQRNIVYRAGGSAKTYLATYREAGGSPGSIYNTKPYMPVGSKSSIVAVNLDSVGNNLGSAVEFKLMTSQFAVAAGATGNYCAAISRVSRGVTIQGASGVSNSNEVTIPIDKTGKYHISYFYRPILTSGLSASSGTINMSIDLYGYEIDRSSYK